MAVCRRSLTLLGILCYRSIWEREFTPYWGYCSESTESLYCGWEAAALEFKTADPGPSQIMARWD